MAKFPGFITHDLDLNEPKYVSEEQFNDEESKTSKTPTDIPSLSIYMLKSIKQNENGCLLIDNKDIFQVKLMGRIVSVVEDQLKSTYQMVDETDKIDVVIYKSDRKIMKGEDDESNFKFSPNCLALVIGMPQIQKNYISFSATSIENINSLILYDRFLLSIILGYCHRNLSNCPEAFIFNQNEISDKKKISTIKQKEVPKLQMTDAESIVYEILKKESPNELHFEDIFDKIPSNSKIIYADIRTAVSGLHSKNLVIESKEKDGFYRLN